MVEETQTRNEKGELQSFNDEPSEVLCFLISGEICEKRWHDCGKLHRDGDKPAVIRYSVPNNKVWWVEYYQHGVQERAGNQPVFESYYYSGKPFIQRWYKDGTCIQYRKYHVDGSIWVNSLYEKGQRVSQVTN